MRVASVSVIGSLPQKCVNKRKSENYLKPTVHYQVSSRGKAGQILGGAIGTGAAVAASFFLSPLILLTGPALVLGCAGGDYAEDVIKKGNIDNNKESK